MPDEGDPTTEQTDSGALDPAQLSQAELEAILGIEGRIRDAQSSPKDSSRPDSTWRDYLVTVEDRFNRVLLLDGGRGTGKTALLLTMAKWWNEQAPGQRKPADKDRDRAIKAFVDSGAKFKNPPHHIPENVQVLSILDFDPLPPGMPLLAGIIQAWRPLADHYEKRLSPMAQTEDDDDGGKVKDLWHQLFRMATAGWSSVSIEHGLIEQVLDREEQVADWQRLGKLWRDFIDQVLASGRKLTKEGERLHDKQVFVIMIDDVDLQVERIRELLPALRMLYHPQVFFIVAADSNHMVDMLTLDFLGKEKLLAQSWTTGDTWQEGNQDQWASILAQAAFEKVFVKPNRWQLKTLSLLDVLAFPKQSADLIPEPSKSNDTKVGAGNPHDPQLVKLFEKSVYASLIRIEKKSQNNSTKSQGVPNQTVGDFLLDVARPNAELLPGVMTYRAIEQLRQAALISQPTNPLEVLAGVLTVNLNAPAVVTGGEVVVPVAGTLSALFQTGTSELSGIYNWEFSTQPDFVFEPRGLEDRNVGMSARMTIDAPRRFGFTQALTAKALEEALFPVRVSGLIWDTYLSLAWTEWSTATSWTKSPLLFVWTRQTHPRPDQLLEHSREWQGFLESKALSEARGRNRLALYAYAWIYYQWKWSFGRPLPKGDPTKFARAGDKEPLWENIIGGNSRANREAIAQWQNVTLPLLARPEIGFPAEVQHRLLRRLEESLKSKERAIVEARRQAITELRREREQLVTDAYIAAAVQRGDYSYQIPSDVTIREYIDEIDTRYQYTQTEHGGNFWLQIVGAAD